MELATSLAPAKRTGWAWNGGLLSPAAGISRVCLASPRGFCVGVTRAIRLVEDALARHGAPVFVRRAIVHNQHVVARLSALGAVFVSEVDQVPEGATVIFSAHGVSKAVRAAAATRRLTTLDATCPLVQKVHSEVAHFVERDYDVVLIGHRGHDEVIGTIGQAPDRVQVVQTAAEADRLMVRNPGRVACVTQTTLTPDDVSPVIRRLRTRFPGLAVPERRDICGATSQRQDATRRLAKMVDVVLVLGDKASSNSQRLREVAEAAGRPAYLIGTIAELKVAWLTGARVVGLTAGTSTPEWVVQEAAAHFEVRGAVRIDAQDGASQRDSAERRQTPAA